MSASVESNNSFFTTHYKKGYRTVKHRLSDTVWWQYMWGNCHQETGFVLVWFVATCLLCDPRHIA